jgi:hypothetical protein
MEQFFQFLEWKLPNGVMKIGDRALADDGEFLVNRVVFKDKRPF